MKLEAIAYTGGKPDVIPSELTDRVLSLMEKQLEIIREMATHKVLIPAGSKLVKTEVPE